MSIVVLYYRIALICLALSPLAACVATAVASPEVITYSDLAEEGRPQQFYQYAASPRTRDKPACDTILRDLNEPLPLKSYDLKPILLRTSFAIDWSEETVSQERRRMPGKVSTATIQASTLPTPIELLIWTVDVRDAPVDSLVLFRQPTINQLRLDDGRIDAGALLPLLAHSNANGEVFAPPPEWVRKHHDHTGDNGGTTFSGDYYWSDAVLVDDRLYVVIASPPQFDDKERLLGFLDVFVAPVGEDRIEDLACHFVHRPKSSQ